MTRAQLGFIHMEMTDRSAWWELVTMKTEYVIRRKLHDSKLKEKNILVTSTVQE